jgi:hypothetical protein
MATLTIHVTGHRHSNVVAVVSSRHRITSIRLNGHACHFHRERFDNGRHVYRLTVGNHHGCHRNAQVRAVISFEDGHRQTIVARVGIVH